MVAEFPTVAISGQVAAAREGLRAMGEAGYGFTHIFVLEDAGQLVGQVTMVDLALAAEGTPVNTLSRAVVASVTVDTRRRSALDYSAITTSPSFQLSRTAS